MTRYENKEYERVNRVYNDTIKNKLFNEIKSYESCWVNDVINLLYKCHIENIQYRDRIKTLKELIKKESVNFYKS